MRKEGGETVLVLDCGESLDLHDAPVTLLQALSFRNDDIVDAVQLC